MSILLTHYPVSAPGQNLFAGNSPIEIKFKREDLSIISTELGADNSVIVNLAQDLTNDLFVGEYAYLSSDFYNDSGRVLEVDTTFIRLEIGWKGMATIGGYINYKQNYYIELKAVDSNNPNINTIPFTLRDDGDDSGIVVFDVSIINDLNALTIPNFSSLNEMVSSRIKFDILYREVWRESTGLEFSAMNNPIIIIPADSLISIEDFNNALSSPEYYVGYPNGAVYMHSDSTPGGSEFVKFYMDEFNINGDAVRENTFMGQLPSATTYGRLFVPLYNLDLLSSTDSFSLRTELAGIPEFSAIDFTDDFNIE